MLTYPEADLAYYFTFEFNILNIGSGDRFAIWDCLLDSRLRIELPFLAY